MGPGHLFCPSFSDMDLAVAVADAVPNDKVIPQCIPPTPIDMICPHTLRCRAVAGRMVNDDALPPIRNAA